MNHPHIFLAGYNKTGYAKIDSELGFIKNYGNKLAIGISLSIPDMVKQACLEGEKLTEPVKINSNRFEICNYLLEYNSDIKYLINEDESDFVKYLIKIKGNNLLKMYIDKNFHLTYENFALLCNKYRNIEILTYINYFFTDLEINRLIFENEYNTLKIIFDKGRKFVLELKTDLKVTYEFLNFYKTYENNITLKPDTEKSIIDFDIKNIIDKPFECKLFWEKVFNIFETISIIFLKNIINYWSTNILQYMNMIIPKINKNYYVEFIECLMRDEKLLIQTLEQYNWNTIVTVTSVKKHSVTLKDFLAQKGITLIDICFFDEKECPICYCEFKYDKLVLNCKHVICLNCYRLYPKICGICRSQVIEAVKIE